MHLISSTKSFFVNLFLFFFIHYVNKTAYIQTKHSTHTISRHKKLNNIFIYKYNCTYNILPKNYININITAKYKRNRKISPPPNKYNSTIWYIIIMSTIEHARTYQKWHTSKYKYSRKWKTFNKAIPLYDRQCILRIDYCSIKMMARKLCEGFWKIQLDD